MCSEINNVVNDIDVKELTVVNRYSIQKLHNLSFMCMSGCVFYIMFVVLYATFILYQR